MGGAQASQSINAPSAQHPLEYRHPVTEVGLDLRAVAVGPQRRGHAQKQTNIRRLSRAIDHLHHPPMVYGAKPPGRRYSANGTIGAHQDAKAVSCTWPDLLPAQPIREASRQDRLV